MFGVRCSGPVLLCSVFGSDVVFCSVFGPAGFLPPTLVNFQPHSFSWPRPEHVFVLCLCSCSDVGSVRVHVCVRLNKCCVHFPVRAERLFVFGQQCSLPILVIFNDNVSTWLNNL